jgi:hypothetical protein
MQTPALRAQQYEHRRKKFPVNVRKPIGTLVAKQVRRNGGGTLRPQYAERISAHERAGHGFTAQPDRG